MDFLTTIDGCMAPVEGAKLRVTGQKKVLIAQANHALRGLGVEPED